MNAPETMKPATQPISLAHKVLLKSDDALCAEEIACAILGVDKPSKIDIKSVTKQLKQLADLGMIEMEPRAVGVPFYRLIASRVAESSGVVIPPPPEHDPASVAFFPAEIIKGLTAGDSEGGETDAPAANAQRDEFTLLGLIADIRAAAGDPNGRLMQDELVQHIAAVVKERDDLRAELAIERQAREALQGQGNATDVTAAAVGYLVRVPKRPPMIRRKLEAARLAALGAVRAGAARAEVMAVVPVGTARRGAEWSTK